jgi:hypothetical protein
MADAFRFTDSEGNTWESYTATVTRNGQRVTVRRRRKITAR